MQVNKNKLSARNHLNCLNINQNYFLYLRISENCIQFAVKQCPRHETSYISIKLWITVWKVSVFGVILVRIFPDSDWIHTRITWIRALFTQWMSSWYFEFKYENLIIKLKLHWIWSKLKIYKCKDLGFGKRKIFLNIMNPVRHSSVSLAKLPLNHYFIFTVLLFDLTSGTFIFKKIP